MTEIYYNATEHGFGLEGIINYTNTLIDGMLGISFISVLFVIMMFVLSKSDWKTSANLVYTSFVCMLLSWTLSLFIEMNELFLYALTLIFAGSIIFSIIDNQS